MCGQNARKRRNERKNEQDAICEENDTQEEEHIESNCSVQTCKSYPENNVNDIVHLNRHFDLLTNEKWNEIEISGYQNIIEQWARNSKEKKNL